MGQEIDARVDIDRRYYRTFPVWTASGFFVVVIAVCVFVFCWGVPLISGAPIINAAIPGLGPPPPPPIEQVGPCPRPQGLLGLQSGFNDQERELRALRKLAFTDDFFAQIELGKRYSAVSSSDRNVEDPIEAAVWYAMALSNPRGYAPLNRSVHPAGFGGPPRVDDCRQWERHTAYKNLDRLLFHMSTEEQTKVRNRTVYVLSTLSADGFRTLARIHDDQYGPFGEPIDDPQALEALGHPIAPGAPAGPGWRSAVNLFPRNDVDAFVYSYIAAQTGDVNAYVMLKDFEHSAPDRISFGGFAEAKAKRWIPPYEFYPPEAPISGVPFSDESHPPGEDIFTVALARMPEVPFVHIGRAFCYLGITDFVATTPAQLPPHAVQTLQAMLGLQMNGVFSNRLGLRAIQYAAVNGSPQAQLVLAVMYEEGVGVPVDYARAFYWFNQADRQGSPDAKFAVSAFYAHGVEGVADQDKAKAVVVRLSSALAGFQPSAQRMAAMLAQVSGPPGPGPGPGAGPVPPGV